MVTVSTKTATETTITRSYATIRVSQSVEAQAAEEAIIMDSTFNELPGLYRADAGGRRAGTPSS